MTFSIVAFDKNNNEIGFAISSCCWNAGTVCLATDKGAIAHQALQLMKNVQLLLQKFINLWRTKKNQDTLIFGLS